MLDATCTPADIKYPTDIEILNEAREKTEETIDELYKQIQGKEKKSQERIGHWYRLARSYKRCNTRGSTNQANLE